MKSDIIPFDDPHIQCALEFAAVKHAGQTRLMEHGKSNVPYIVHPYRVGRKLQAVLTADPSVYDNIADVVMAGILHDVLEDTDTTLNDVIHEFGLPVATLVGKVSHARTRMSWHEKNEAYLSQITDAPLGAVLISLCDKLDNMCSIIGNNDAGFNGFKILKSTPKKQVAKFYNLYRIYYARLHDVVPNLLEEYRIVLSTVVRQGSLDFELMPPTLAEIAEISKRTHHDK